MNFYPFHIGDYAAHTAHLSPIEDIAYRRLLDLCYLTEKPLMHDVERLSRLVRLSDHVEAVRVVLDEFFQATDEGWISPRAVQEISAYEDKRQKAKASARASVNVRSTNAQRTFNERSTDVQLPEPIPEPEPTNTQPSAVVETPGVSASPDCPHVEVLELWAKHLPMARQPAEWNEARRTMLRQRWREKAARQKLEWWDRFFAYIAESDFLTGKTQGKDRRPFLLSLDWLLKPANFLKVIEGAYHTEVN